MASAEMSSARSRLRTTRCRSSDRTGAKVKPQLPMTAVVTPWKHELSPNGSHAIWASMWVCTSMNPGLTTRSLASISRSAERPLRLPISAITPSCTKTSAISPGRPVPSITVPPRRISSLIDAPKSCLPKCLPLNHTTLLRPTGCCVWFFDSARSVSLMQLVCYSA